jgi:lipopolysaccharide export system protein LptA
MTQPSKFSLPAWLIGAVLAAAATCASAQKTDAPAKPAAAPAGQAADKPAAKPAAKSGSNGKAATPEEEPSTLILSDTLHYDDVKKESVFTGNVVMTRGLMNLHSDQLEMREDAQGNQYGTATANAGKLVTIRQDRPETFELIEGTGLRAEYDGTKSQFDLIGQAIVIRYVCGKQFDTIRGQRVRYNDKAGTYEAIGGPASSAPGGRVRSVVEPRARSDAAIEECRKQQAAKGQAPAGPAAKSPASRNQPAKEQPNKTGPASGPAAKDETKAQ